jgi:hypothetical protein
MTTFAGKTFLTVYNRFMCLLPKRSEKEKKECGLFRLILKRYFGDLYKKNSGLERSLEEKNDPKTQRELSMTK